MERFFGQETALLRFPLALELAAGGGQRALLLRGNFNEQFKSLLEPVPASPLVEEACQSAPRRPRKTTGTAQLSLF